MPEGVEVKLSADLIRPLVVGKLITKVEVGTTSRYAENPPNGMVDFSETFKSSELGGWVQSPVVVSKVETKGKFMYWSFDNGWYMFSTFGMTGQWSPLPGKHICLHIGLHDSQDINGAFSDIYYNDPRHFGTIQFTNSKQELLSKLEDLGWDPLAHEMDEKWINNVAHKLGKTIKPIGQVMMDQGVFAGVGNYIRAEALYLAKMSPWRPSNLLKKEEILSLCQAIVDVMKDSYAHQGATILTYKDAYGAEGKYSSCFKVYGQKTDPFGHKIVKEETADKRTIHWCPTVQR